MSLERFSQAISTWEVQSEVRGKSTLKANQTRQRVPEALWRIPVRLRVIRRAALVALVGSGWENEWSRVVQFARNACSWGSKRLSS